MELKNINTNSFKNNFKTLPYHTNWIFHLDKLKDGRLISCSYDKSLNIYKKDSYDLQLSIKEHSSGINSFTQLNNGKILTCSSDKTIKIIELTEEDKYKVIQTLEGHTNTVCKIIEIKENELISIACDKIMKIWKLNKENKFECITNIYFQDSDNDSNIIKLNKNEFVTSSYEDKNIKFWNINNYSNIAIINNINCSFTYKNMCLLENNLLCIGGENINGFYLIEISSHQIIKKIFGPKTILSINICLDNLILCSIYNEKGNNCLVKYKYEEQNFKKVVEKENAHDSWIFSCVELNDGIIASGGFDKFIKLWKD